jgi:hypothetical protein
MPARTHIFPAVYLFVGLLLSACTAPPPATQAPTPILPSIAPSLTPTPRYAFTLVATPTADPRRLIPHQVDLDCDGQPEFFSFTYRPPHPYNPQARIAYTMLRFEAGNEKHIWGSNTTGTVSAELFHVDACEQLFAIFNPAAGIPFRIYRWDGSALNVVLEAGEHEHIPGDWNAIAAQPQTPDQLFTLKTKEFSPECLPAKSHLTTHRWYQWDDGRFDLVRKQSWLGPLCN